MIYNKSKEIKFWIELPSIDYTTIKLIRKYCYSHELECQIKCDRGRLSHDYHFKVAGLNYNVDQFIEWINELLLVLKK